MPYQGMTDISFRGLIRQTSLSVSVYRLGQSLDAFGVVYDSHLSSRDPRAVNDNVEGVRVREMISEEKMQMHP